MCAIKEANEKKITKEKTKRNFLHVANRIITKI